MNKYEIMILINGTLSEKDADLVNLDLQKKLKETKNFSEKKMGLLKTAYPIKRVNTAYYYVYNFETDNYSILNEFSHAILLNKNVLRHLITNIGKNYGYLASINPKKMERAKLKQKKFLEKQKKLEAALANKKIENQQNNEMGGEKQ